MTSSRRRDGKGGLPVVQGKPERLNKPVKLHWKGGDVNDKDYLLDWEKALSRGETRLIVNTIIAAGLLVSGLVTLAVLMFA